jgi:hypothetical protein
MFDQFAALVGGAWFHFRLLSIFVLIFWLEMESAVGWEKMILVVGYAANGPICERLAAVARIDAPAREFRCNTAN